MDKAATAVGITVGRVYGRANWDAAFADELDKACWALCVLGEDSPRCATASGYRGNPRQPQEQPPWCRSTGCPEWRRASGPAGAGPPAGGRIASVSRDRDEDLAIAWAEVQAAEPGESGRTKPPVVRPRYGRRQRGGKALCDLRERPAGPRRLIRTLPRHEPSPQARQPPYATAATAPSSLRTENAQLSPPAFRRRPDQGERPGISGRRRRRRPRSRPCPWGCRTASPGPRSGRRAPSPGRPRRRRRACRRARGWGRW